MEGDIEDIGNRARRNSDEILNPSLQDNNTNNYQSKPDSKPISIPSRLLIYEAFLLWCGISISAYLGSYIRVGISYFKIWKLESNFSIMYAQVIGCFLMGFISHHKLYLWNRSRFHRILYITLTSGLCGSITTFSTWNMECNKIFYLELDSSWGNSMGSYNGARIFEWLICMWVGIALPISALHLGHHIALLSKKSNARFKIEEESDSKNRVYFKSEVSMIFVYFIATGLVVVLPVIFSWIHLAYTAAFGAIGAYLRYQLSKLNVKYVNFPLGTFIANVIATWLLAVWTLLAKFEVDYNRIGTMAVLYGLSTGFCGCLSTVSTFVNELDTMNIKHLYRYGLATFIVSQLGCVLIFDIYAYRVVPTDEVMPDSLNFCHSYSDLCTKLLERINCNPYDSVLISCEDDLSSFQSRCECGSLDLSPKISKILIDSQSKHNITHTLVPVWPTHSSDYDHPTEVIDICLSYENACQHFLDRISCPRNLQHLNGCDRKSILSYQGICECGDLKLSSTRIADLILSSSLNRRYDMLPYIGYPFREPVNMCEAYNIVCSKVMEHIQCPENHRNIQGCENVKSPYMSWVRECSCGSKFKVASKRVAGDILDSLVKNYYWDRMVRIENSDKVEVCESYKRICELFLDSIGCEKEIRNVRDCRYGLASFIGNCECGKMSFSSDNIRDLVIEGSLAQDITQILYIPPPVPPYTLVAQSNPYKPLESSNIIT